MEEAQSGWARPERRLAGPALILASAVFWLSALTGSSAHSQEIPATDILGDWYFAYFARYDGPDVPADYATQQHLVISGREPGLTISNANAGIPVPLARENEHTFKTSSGASYDLQFTSGNHFLLTGGGTRMHFGRRDPGFKQPAAPPAQPDTIAFTDAWAGRVWFERFLARFSGEHGRSFESCFSDRLCLSSCPVTQSICSDLGGISDAYIAEGRARDPLFLDAIAAASIQRALADRRQIIRFRQEMENAKAKSLLLAHQTILDFFQWLAVDAGSQVFIPAVSQEDSDHARAAIQNVGCTLAGLVPIAGYVAAINCSLISLAQTAATNSVSLADDQGKGISLNRVMDALIDAQAKAHDLSYNKNDVLFDVALQSESTAAAIAKLIGSGKIASPVPLDSERMKRQIWATVWPYAFFGYGVGPKSGSDILQMTREQACSTERLQAGWGPADFGVTVHEHLTGASVSGGKHTENQYARIRWALYTGTVSNGRPLSEEAFANLRMYLLDSGFTNSLFVEFRDSGRLFVESRYSVSDSWNWFPPIKYSDITLFPNTAGVIAYPHGPGSTKGAALVGPVILGDAGKRALGFLRCYQGRQ